MDTTRYRILDTAMGLIISESRTSVLDVMEAAEAGDDVYAIAQTFNLTPLQVETALAYIAAHRDELAPQLARARAARRAREARYRAQEAEFERRVQRTPMTSRRAAVYARIEEARQARQNRGEQEGREPDGADSGHPERS